MVAETLIIEERNRDSAVAASRSSDFTLRPAGEIDARIVLQYPNVSLYCLDFEKRCGLFVETPPGLDLTRVPFLYAAQYAEATRVIRVPFDTMHELAAEVPFDGSRLILIYSIGRCGSTLLSAAFTAVDGVESLSEPDVSQQMLGTWGTENLAGDEKIQLLKTCTVLQCMPGRNKGATAWAMKFRSQVTEMWPLFYAAFPEAKAVFLYRHPEPWAQSFYRLSGGDPTAQNELIESRSLFGRQTARLETRDTVSTLEMMAYWWLSGMESAVAMQNHGVPLFPLRYEELTRTPKETLTALFAFCGLAGNVVGDLDAVLARDSQAGTVFSRDNPNRESTPLNTEHLKELRRLIRETSPDLTADTILPETYFP